MATTKPKPKDTTKGEGPILEAGPTVELGSPHPRLGTTSIETARLGLKDAFALARALLHGAATYSTDLSDIDTTNPAEVVKLLAGGLAFAEGEMTGILARLLHLEPSEVTDPDLVPMAALPAMLSALWTHPDLRAVLDQLPTRNGDAEGNA